MTHSSRAFMITEVTVWKNTAVHVVNGIAEYFFGEAD
jgi:hypothetical protein